MSHQLPDALSARGQQAIQSMTLFQTTHHPANQPITSDPGAGSWLLNDLDLLGERLVDSGDVRKKHVVSKGGLHNSRIPPALSAIVDSIPQTVVV